VPVPGVSFVLWNGKAAVETLEADCVVVASAIAPDAAKGPDSAKAPESAIASESAIAAAVRRHANAGGPTLGLGPGFASLCNLGLLPGRLEPSSRPMVAQACLRVEGRPTPFTAGIPAGRVLHLPLANAAAYHSGEWLKLEQAGQVVFRYCDQWAGLGDAHNPYAAPAAIAGISCPEGHVVGLQAWLPMLGKAPLLASQQKDAEQMFASLALWVAQRRAHKPLP